MPKKHSSKELTESDKHDWADAVQEVEPYEAPAERPESPRPDIEVREQRRAFKPLNRKSAPKASQLEPLEVGAYRSMDRRNAERMRKGKLSVDAVLDLHGMRQEDACEHFYRFIQQQQDGGARCVLVITGQGKRSGHGPVLQQALQRWVNEPFLRPFIVALDYATPAQGGKGAYLLYLRRNRSLDGAD